ncbi:MAG: class I SAM-dependent methyltransferase, partial [Pseudomonadales bacterium]|nr:class I SAM-dependent methyltransferase [Pseudomonadales bacterium]
MTDSRDRDAASWEAYWRGAGESNAGDVGGVNQPAVDAFWLGHLPDALPAARQQPRILDIATGNGAMIAKILASMAGRDPQIECVDVSPSAIDAVSARFPFVSGKVGDVSRLPYDDGAFDLVVSQFGLEYAGENAFREAARVVAPGGRLALVVHIQEGAVYRECRDNLDALQRLRASNFITLARQMFEEAFTARTGGSREAYESAARQLQPAIEELDGIMSEYGTAVADNTISQLYDGVRRIHERIVHYDANEVLTWLARMNEEVDTFIYRMSSMLGSAIDEAGFEEICAVLRDGDLFLEQTKPLVPATEELPVAWLIVAGRRDDASHQGEASPSQRAEPAVGEDVRLWVADEKKRAIDDLMAGDRIDDEFFEVDVEAALPFKALIGSIRRPRDTERSQWFVTY